MDALVLGGTWFIGLHLVRALSERGDRVTVLNRGQTEADLPGDVARLTADRTDPAQVRRALRGRSFDVAYDISGYTPESLAPVIESLEGNVRRFVFCSTTGVYAPAETVPIEEDFPLIRGPDASQYSRDKVLCEDLLTEAFEGRGFPVSILRPPYVYGPDNSLRHREFSYFARLSAGRKIIIPGTGRNLVHAVHVDDLVEAFVATPNVEVTRGQAYTICGPDAITLNGWIDAMGAAAGLAPKVVHAAPEQYSALHVEAQTFPYAWDGYTVYTSEKAQRHMEWSPRYRMGAGLKMTFEWWKAQGMDREEWDFSVEDRALEILDAGP